MSANPNSEELLAKIQAAIEVNSIGGTETNPVVTADGLVGDMLNIIDRLRDRRAADSRANQAVVTDKKLASAVEGLQIALDEFDRECDYQATIEGENTELWDEIEVNADAVRTVIAALSRAEGQEPVAVNCAETVAPYTAAIRMVREAVGELTWKARTQCSCAAPSRITMQKR